jgi:tetratricopeptide (TPR) repeat protein
VKTILPALILAVACGAALPVSAQQPAQQYDVLRDPDFAAATGNFSAAEQLEFAAHFSMALRQHERAIPMYEALVKRSPNRAELWAMLAAAYNRADEPREALDAADIAYTLAPHYPHFRVERGIAAYRLGRHDQAAEDLKAFVKAFPVNARGHFYLGLAEGARGNADAAYAALMRARTLNPGLTLMTDYYLGLILTQRGQVGTGRQLVAEAQRAFGEAGLPAAKLAAGQLESIDAAVADRMRAAVHQSDVQFAPARRKPGAP